MSGLPPDLEIRAFALQAAVTALGTQSVHYGNSGVPSEELKALVAEFRIFLSRCAWSEPEVEAPWTAENAVGPGMI